MKTIPVLTLAIAEDRTIKIPRATVETPSNAADIARAMIGSSPVEKLIVIMLDAKNNVTGVSVVAQGVMSRTLTDTPTILRHVLAAHCAAFVLAHNHPSGDPTPSADDVKMTRIVAKGAEAIGIPLLDHVIVTRSGSFSCIPLDSV